MTERLQTEGLIVVKALLSDRLLNAELFSGCSLNAVKWLTECTGCTWIAVEGTVIVQAVTQTRKFHVFANH